MSFCVKKTVQFSRGGLENIPQFDNGTTYNGLQLLSGILHDIRYVWQAKGPILEVKDTKTGSKVGGWVFGGILKDSNTRIVCVEEIPRPNSRISLLAIGIECTISGGIICIFDIFSSKVIRAIQIKERIASLHVIDPGIEDLNLPGTLRNFDGILAAGTEGGDVILIDICRQICEESLHSSPKRDELNPSQLILLTAEHIAKIEYYKERSVRDGNNLAIHLNAIFDSGTEHFVLKGPKGDDRIHVNKEEVVASALYYCPQLTSLLVGYNFGAFQLWDLTSLRLVYTSPVCDEHFPVTSFALQEPTDDPRAFCYIWVAYSNTELYQTGLPFAVMYSFCYESKEYHEGYGYLYQDFHYCTIRFQVELGQLEDHGSENIPKGGYCLGFQPITKLSTNKECFYHSLTGDTLALCLVSWIVWFSKSNAQTYCLIFDLNQWYKAQMPSFTKWKDSNNYMLCANLSEKINLNGQKESLISNVLMEKKSLSQFIGIQKLEEHFYPTSLSFNLWILRESDIILVHNEGLQKHLLSQLEAAGPLCLVRPTDICRQAITVGLTPLFIDIHPNTSISIEAQRETIFNVALEHQLIGWLCKCATEWANGSFSSAGCSLDFIVTWAFQRAVVLKSNCDKYCIPLFDYSQTRLDSNTNALLNSCTRQINSLCIFYKHIVNKLWSFVGCLEVIKDHWTELEMVSVYFEVLQWLVNVGLLPECHPSTYPRRDISERISAPYPVQELTDYYNEQRAELRLLSKETFENNDSLLFIDNLIDRKCGGKKLQKQWQDDGGSGLYPPPSLQSLIRTYLVDGAGISHKHSLVIYLFLDLAMALDQSRYSAVVTNLIKFPAVFKVTPSIIKITQAFWQLDHGDFPAAMEQLLDPFVLGEDLQSWHHSIVMRSFLIHKQPNFALLYMQIRKPPITDEKDLLTAISLFIANNMLDEAFYFKKQYQNNNEEKLLIHLFRECSKNDALHLILYKCLNTDEEKAFFRYLKSVPNPTLDDLQIFYYLLRSRFIEAFDAHSNIKKKRPERQGMIGQSMSSKMDQIVNIFKTLMPDVNKNLIEYIRRERTNVWKEVQRPTPLSVFVHNTTEHVKYKSTLIHAALAKAKHTFPDSVNQSYYKDLVTEETPFLRIPTAYRNGKRATTLVITPRILDINENADDVSAPPSKIMKVSPRISTATYVSPLQNVSQSIIGTPIVKRKTAYQSLTHSNANVCTPQSILKVKHLVRQRDSITDETLPMEETENQFRSDLCSQGINLSLQPRRSLSRTPKRQHVQFDDSTKFASSLSDQSIKLLDVSLEDQIHHKSSLSSKDISAILSPSSTEDGNDDVFYSPENSVNIAEDTEDISIEQEMEPFKDKLVIENIEVIQKDVEVGKAEEPSNKTELEFVKEDKHSDIKVIAGSPKARKSYKKVPSEVFPTRSSPRLSKILTPKKKEPLSRSKSESNDPKISEDQISSNESDSTDSRTSKSIRILPKLKGRKSLTRKVLENNTFSKILASPAKDNIKTKEYAYSKSEKTVMTEKYSYEADVSVSETNLKSLDTEEKEHFSDNFVKKQCLERTLDTDTSLGSDVSFYSGELLEESNMKLSDSLQEYIDFLTGKNENDQCENKVSITENLNLPSNIEEIAKSNEIIEKPPQAMLIERESSPVEELLENKEKIDDSAKDILETAQLSINIQETSVEEKSVEVNQESKILTELIPVEIQEKGTKDISSSPATDLQMKTHEVISNENSVDREQELSYNELEVNIFGITGKERTSMEKTETSTTFIDESDIYDMPDSEIAFLEDSLEGSNELKTDSIVIISSGEDEDNSSNQLSVSSIYSKSAENVQDEEDSSDVSEDAQLLFQYEEQEITEDILENTKYKASAMEVNEEQVDRLEETAVKEKELTQYNDLSEDLQIKQILDEELTIDKAANSTHLQETKLSEEEVVSFSLQNVLNQNFETVERTSNINEIRNYDKVTNLTTIVEETTISTKEISKIFDCGGNAELEKNSTQVNQLVEEKINAPVNINENTAEEMKTAHEPIYVAKEEVNKMLGSNTGSEERLIKSDEPIGNTIGLIVHRDQKKTTSSLKTTVAQPPNIETTETLASVESQQETLETGLVQSNQTNSNDIIIIKPKIDQSTNTTIILHNIVRDTLKEKETKIDQSTNTHTLIKNTNKEKSKEIEKALDKSKSTVNRQENLMQNITKHDQEIKHSIVESIKGPQTRKIYAKTKNNAPDDQPKSSDTAEDETFWNERVVVEAQTPSTSANKLRNTSSEIITTKNSDPKSKTLVVQLERNADIYSKNVGSSRPKLGKRTRRALSESETEGVPNIPLQKLDNINIDCDPNTSTKIIDDAPMVKLTLRKKRSASVDEVKTFSKRATRKTNKSVCGEIKEDDEVRKTNSGVQMPVICEENVKEGIKTFTKAKSVSDAYATARRLTRRQANMVKDLSILEDVDRNYEPKNQIDLEPINPINLLDKQSFEGKCDPDERTVYEPSSPSSSTKTSVPRGRKSRSASVVSDISLPHSQNIPATPKKSGRSTRSQTRSPVAAGILTSRKNSETSSVVSEHSASSTPPKKSRKKKLNEDGEPSVRSTRSRSASVSSIKSDEPTPRKLARSKRILSAKSNLPQITEDKNVENVDDTPVFSKNAR